MLGWFNSGIEEGEGPVCASNIFSIQGVVNQRQDDQPRMLKLRKYLAIDSPSMKT